MPGLKQSLARRRVLRVRSDLRHADALDYRGPQFGWWRIPDQFSLAALDAREIQCAAAQTAVRVLPHPQHAHAVPANAPAAGRLGRACSQHTRSMRADVQRSITETPQWTNMGSSYSDSVRYAFEVLASYVRYRKDEHFVLIVLGDHQPAANVSGEGASWDVPVQVVSDRPDILESLEIAGFHRTAPHRTISSIGPMHQLGPVLLRAFTQ